MGHDTAIRFTRTPQHLTTAELVRCRGEHGTTSMFYITSFNIEKL